MSESTHEEVERMSSYWSWYMVTLGKQCRTQTGICDYVLWCERVDTSHDDLAPKSKHYFIKRIVEPFLREVVVNASCRYDDLRITVARLELSRALVRS